MAYPGKGKWKWKCMRYLALIFIMTLLFSGFELSRIGNSKSGGRQQKFHYLALGPAAGQGLPNRIQCQGLNAIKKRPLPSLSGLTLVNRKISFVSVFAIYNQSLQTSVQRASTNVTVGNTTFDKIGRSMEILNVFANFIKVSMPKSNIFILTDATSNFPAVPSNAAVMHIPGNYSRNNLMLQRIKSYIDFLEARLSGNIWKQNQVEHFIFTDSDIAVVDDLSHIYEDYRDFHIALTFRNNKHQPLNSGVIFVRGTVEGVSKAKAFLEEVLEAYKSMFMKAARMLGDQLALNWIVKSQPLFDVKRFRAPKAFVAEVHRTRVLFLPCSIFNWTPPEGAGQFHGMPEDVKVIHFKGSRKRLMLESWNFFKSHPVDFSDMMCLILKSGRTKYDF
ncbi:hypothetical protein SUGI_1046640 [Cryptomeria japonica]|uniref:uncharacterized protein LOC131067542 n=1 Tax=Cryptomeria japonica TaxID=3369 RepID=UPI002414C472|nr:uncharacterized protein LOC131067542 [Cryptomeria japonica]GLJ49429.1 hypothetical protein SUGI_1046640 [Cryptomeria japonica]